MTCWRLHPMAKPSPFRALKAQLTFSSLRRTRKIRQRLPGDSSPVQHLVFSPDGSHFLVAGPDGSALIWELFHSPPARPVNAEQVAAWWKALADPDAGQAYRTMKEMAASPAKAVTLLRTKLPPIRAVEASRLDSLLARLDSDEFKEREAASANSLLWETRLSRGCERSCGVRRAWS